jgi:hypothetical protein
VGTPDQLVNEELFVIVDNKHHCIAVRSPVTVNEKDQLSFIWSYTPRSTRSTRFKAKKILKAKVMKLLRKYMESVS